MLLPVNPSSLLNEMKILTKLAGKLILAQALFEYIITINRIELEDLVNEIGQILSQKYPIEAENILN